MKSSTAKSHIKTAVAFQFLRAMERGSTSKFEDALELIARAHSLDDLRSLITDLRDLYGLAQLIYFVLQPHDPQKIENFYINTYSPEWKKRYLDREYITIDPVVHKSRIGFLPFDWSGLEDVSFQAKEFFRESYRYEIGRHGMTLPIRGPAGERALIAFTSNCSETDWAKISLTCMHDLLALAPMLHDRMMRLNGLRSAEPHLSRREKECLQLSARGFAPKQIAAKLGLSHASYTTVHLYLRNACTKLGCDNLNQAIAKAIRLEIIDA